LAQLLLTTVRRPESANLHWKGLSVWLRTSWTATRQPAQLLVPTQLRMSWLLTPL